MSNAWARGSTTAWRRTRAIILARDGYQCRAHTDGWCDMAPGEHTCTHTATTVHHTHGRAVTGDDPAHLVASCAACNLHIGDPTKHGDPPGRSATRW